MVWSYINIGTHTGIFIYQLCVLHMVSYRGGLALGSLKNFELNTNELFNLQAIVEILSTINNIINDLEFKSTIGFLKTSNISLKSVVDK